MSNRREAKRRISYFPVSFACRTALEKMSDEERGKLFLALLDYAELGKRPVIEGQGSIIFPFMADFIDRTQETYAAQQAGREKGGEATKNKWDAINAAKAQASLSNARPMLELGNKQTNNQTNSIVTACASEGAALLDPDPEDDAPDDLQGFRPYPL